MKHSTFYSNKNGKQIYTTIKNTPYHDFLRSDHNGTTYNHDDNAILYFIIGMPLDKPMGKNIKRIEP
jgi:hypothetical protein